jgi:hypothetical protein
LKYLKDSNGFTLTEFILAALIGVVLLSGVVNTFVNQREVFENETEKTNIRATGRLAIKKMADLIRNAGYGFPSGQGIVSADNSSLSFRTNTDNVSTYLTSEIAAVSTTSFTVRPGEASNFSVNDKIVIYNINDSSNFDINTIQTVDSGTNTITATSSFANAYSSLSPVIISTYHDISFSLDTANNQINKTVDGGNTTTISSKVGTDGLDFDYFDSANAEITSLPVSTTSNIQKIKVLLTLQDTQTTQANISLETQINLRNVN